MAVINEPGFDIRSVFNKSEQTESKYDDIAIIDNDWIKSRFMVADDSLSENDKASRYMSTAELKFTDTSLGGNISINPKPQYTAYCDVSPTKITNRNNTSLGSSNNIAMGRYYSEAIDDNQHVIFMEFGVPKFNSLTDFFFRAIDYETSVIANTGRSTIAYKVGSIIGGGIMLAAFPLMTLLIWGLKLGAKLLMGHGSYNYYYLDTTMPTYWGTVNQIVSELAIEMGIMVPFLNNPKDPNDPKPSKPIKGKTKIGVPYKIKSKDLDLYRELMPGLISDKNYIDVFAIATRSQTLANRRTLKEYEAFENNKIGVQDYLDGKVAGIMSEYTFLDQVNIFTTFERYLSKTVDKTADGDKVSPAKETSSTTNGKKTLTPEEKAKLKKAIEDKSNRYTANSDGTSNVNTDPVKESTLRKFVSGVDSSIRQGGAYAAFSVDYKGSVTETFSNSTGRIETGEKAKSLARKSRNLKFDFAGGNVAMGMDKALGYVQDLAAGVLDSVTFGLSAVLQTAFGGAFIDLPKKWEDSSAYFPTMTYTMKLISPYGNTLSQLQNIYIPLSMLLAGTLPISTGGSSYTSPFLCSVFNKGIQKVSMGMITSLSITRGTSNLGFDKKRRPLAIDVSFTITNFSTMISSPINTSVFSDIFSVTIDDDTPFGNYVAVLGGRDLMTHKYKSQRIKINESRLAAKIAQATNASYYGMMVGNALEDLLGPVVARRTLTGQFNN